MMDLKNIQLSGRFPGIKLPGTGLLLDTLKTGKNDGYELL